MSVHTLREDGGIVIVGAAVTKAEALEAGPQILRYCYEVNGRPAPIVLDRPEVIPTCRVSCPDGLVEAHDGNVVFVPNSGPPRVLKDPAALAAAVAAVHEAAVVEPDPDEVERLAAFLSEEVTDTSPEGLARQVLRRFAVEERTDGWVRHPKGGA